MHMLQKFYHHLTGYLRGVRKLPLIFDVGMHEAQDTDFYLKKGFRVVAVEANPLLVEKAAEHYEKEIAEGRLTILNKGIAKKPGTFTFYLNETHSEWSSFVKEIGAREGAYHEIQVECMPLGELLDKYGCPYYLKIDIEGHDFIALKALEGRTEKPNYVSVENGSQDILDFFHAQGYTEFKFINQGKVTEQECPQPAREGQYVEYTFPYGSSGLFGEETPGEWVDYPTICKQVNDYWSIPNRDALVHGWFDVHAKLGN